MARLQLLLGDKREIIDGPSCGTIAKALRIVFSKPDSWATLSRGPYDFVTAARRQEDGITLEYEMGSPDIHYRVKGWMKIEAVIRVFRAYARQEDSWFADFQWEIVALNDIDYKRTPEHYVFKDSI